jgi:SAM-dependent methyltransferase
MTSAADDIIGVYRRHARAWATDRGNRLIERAWLDLFLALLPADAAILDIGCGSGEPIGRYLIEQGRSVTGVDSSPEMIEMCKAHFPAQDWYVADMRGLSLGRVFDGIIAWDSLWHLCPDDQRRMFPIFREHTAPHAALMFTSGPSAGEGIGDLRGDPLYHASLDEQEYRELLNEHGFDVVAHMIDDPICGLHTTWLAQLGQLALGATVRSPR